MYSQFACIKYLKKYFVCLPRDQTTVQLPSTVKTEGEDQINWLKYRSIITIYNLTRLNLFIYV